MYLHQNENRGYVITIYPTVFTRIHHSSLPEPEQLRPHASTMYYSQNFILRITGFLDSVHRPVFSKLENTTFRKPHLFPSSDDGGETPILFGPLQRANRNHRTTLKAQKPSNSECYTPSSEPFRIYQNL
jgi:hypothetical protein